MSGTVVLGLLDEAIPTENDDKLVWSVNKFGGIPNWMVAIPESYPNCNLCHQLLYLVAQVYCPLEESIYHRTLYIFGCANTVCWNKPGSWKALRSQCKDKVEPLEFESKGKQENVSSDWDSSTWCEDADDWGMDGENCDALDVLAIKCKKTDIAEELNRLQEKTAALVISDNEEKPTKSQIEYPMKYSGANMPTFIPYYLSVMEEPRNKENELTKHELKLLRDYERREGSVEEIEDPKARNNKSGNEKYEKTSFKHGDKLFHQFHKRISRCSAQLLRYQWNGEPLLYSGQNKPSQDLSAIPHCPNCKSVRVFELQLLPTLACFLQGRKLLHVTNNDKKDEPITLDRIMEDETIAVDRIMEAATNIDEYDPVSVKTDKPLQPSEIGTENNTVISKNMMEVGNMPQTDDNCEAKARIEFGTVFVYTCSNSCWSDNEHVLREELVILQSDPDASLFA